MAVTGSRKPFILGIILLALLLGGAVPAFSQEILTSFAFGYENIGTAWANADSGENHVWAANVLFVGRSGLTISGGAEFATDYTFVTGEPLIGIGYVYYNTIYFGGILNVIPRTYFGILAPTLVAGLDFGSLLVEARASYMYGFIPDCSGFRISIGVGVNVGSGASSE